MSETAKHTPIPWAAASPMQSGATRTIEIAGSGGYVGSLSRVLPNSPAKDAAVEAEHIANAAFIVLAVNSHDALVAACKVALADYETLNLAAKVARIHPFTLTPADLRAALQQAGAQP